MISLLSPDKPLSYQEVAKLSKPEFMEDLNLDYLIDRIVSAREEPELRPYFYWLSPDFETSRYRQEVCQDLRDPAIREILSELIAGISTAVRYLQYSETVSASAQKWKWRLDAILTYYQAMEDMCARFNAKPPKAKAFYALHERFFEVLSTQEVQKLRAKSQSLNQEFLSMRYHITINKDRATFTFRYDDTDYCFLIRNAFEHGNADPTPVYFEGSPFSSGMEISALEGFVLNQFYKKNRVLFRDLETFCGIRREIVTQETLDIIREIRFYLAVLEFEEQMEEKGFPFTVPLIVKDKELYLDDCYDAALAVHHAEIKKEVVFNDIMKANFEKAIIVTGPNQGGKTTLARAFGQAFYLGMMGFRVPGRLAKLPFVNQIYTLFSCENVGLNVESRLHTELQRVRTMLEEIGNRSIVIMNELFTSAPTMDALSMSRTLLQTLLKGVHAICFCVTHTYELACDSDDYVSLVATVVEDGTFRRTFRIVRKEANGIAFANSIADKYKLNYSHINYRIQKNG